MPQLTQAVTEAKPEADAEAKAGRRQRKRSTRGGIIIIANDIASLNEMLNNRKAKCPCAIAGGGARAVQHKQANSHTQHTHIYRQL